MDDVPFQPSWLLHAGGMPVARQPDLDVEAFVASFECAVGALRHAERSPASDERQTAPVQGGAASAEAWSPLCSFC